MNKLKLTDRVKILHGRTPIEFAPRLSEKLGCNLFLSVTIARAWPEEVTKRVN